MNYLSLAAASYLDLAITVLCCKRSDTCTLATDGKTLTNLRQLDEDLFELVEHTEAVLPSRRILIWKSTVSCYCALRSRGQDGLLEAARLGRARSGRRLVFPLNPSAQADLTAKLEAWVDELRNRRS